MKVMTIAGTRPEWIKLSCIIRRLDQVVAEHILVNTGQNYDFELSERFFTELGIRRADASLEAAGQGACETIANVILATDKVLKKHQPDAVVILGDTDSSLAAIAARKNLIPVFHIEAGNRCFDANVPEELNRRIVDHTSDFNLCYSEHARRNLIAEGLSTRRIFLIGSPMNEVLRRYNGEIEASQVLSENGLEPRRYLLASFHRQEAVDKKESIEAIIASLETLARLHSVPVLVTTHPRTRSMMEKYGINSDSEHIKFLKPFGFFDYVCLQRQALCVLSDSGTVSEESAMLGFPAVTIRNAMERPEALESGCILISGIDKRGIVDTVNQAVSLSKENYHSPSPPEYQIENTSERVVRLVLGLTRLRDRWSGIDPN